MIILKTKKTSKILSVVLTLAVLVCSLSAVSGFVTTAETNSEESAINNLKTAWQSLYTESSIANFNTDKFMMNQISGDNAISDSFGSTFTFNEDGSFNKTPTSQTTYHRGLVFNVKAGERFTSASSAFNNAFNNNDSLYFTFNPGTVNANGKLLVILQYNGWNSVNELYAEVPVNVGDTGDKKIEIEKLTYKCADATNYPGNYTFTKPSGMLKSQVNDSDLHTIKIMFDATANVSNAKVSSLQGAKYAALPAGNEDFTALDWYNAAKNVDVTGYENATAFTTALNNLKTYLSENDPNFVVSELKTAWQSLYTESSIANFPIDSPVITSQHADDNIYSTDDYAKKFTFNQDGTFNKTANPNNTTTYLRGIVFKLNNGKVFTYNSNSTNNNAFNNAFNNNDSLYFTFNPGTVNANGNLLVLLQYRGYGGTYVLYAEVPVKVGDIGDKKIEIEKLTYKCADKANYPNNEYTFTKPSGMLKSPVNDSDLHTIKIMFDGTADVSNAKVSSLQGAKYAALPEGNEDFTALKWYNAAKDLDVSGYENATAFTTALNNLKTYLSENDPNFLVSELKESWGKLSKDVSIAEFNSNSKIVNQQNMANDFKEASAMGIKFNDDGTFDKASYDVGAFGGNNTLYGLVFNKNVGDKNELFGSNLDSSDNNSFTNAFSDDSLYFTFNPGNVSAGGNLKVYLQYAAGGSKNVLQSQIDITTSDSNIEKKIVIKDLVFKCANSADTATYDFINLSKALTYTNADGATNKLTTIKVFFNPGLATTGASISELKTVKSETVPGDTDSNELISGKSLRVNTGFYGEIADNFVTNRDKFYNYLMTDKTLGNVNETETGDVDICDLVALVKLGYENDGTYKLIADMNKDGYITEADKTELRSNILNR